MRRVNLTVSQILFLQTTPWLQVTVFGCDYITLVASQRHRCQVFSCLFYISIKNRSRMWALLWTWSYFGLYHKLMVLSRVKIVKSLDTTKILDSRSKIINHEHKRELQWAWYPEGYPGKRSSVRHVSSCMSVTWYFYAPRTYWKTHLSPLKAMNLSVFDRALPFPMPLPLVQACHYLWGAPYYSYR